MGQSPFFDPKRELDQVVGKSYHEHARRPWHARLAAGAGKWVAGAAFAIAMAALVFVVLRSQSGTPHTLPGVVKKPVVIQVIPVAPQTPAPPPQK